jgi:D-sedoheptulose 7-phosphate isomerase
MENTLIEAFIETQIEESYRVKKKILEDSRFIGVVCEASKKCVEIYRNGQKTLIAGNGGSAADAQHIAGEFVSKLNMERPGIASIALTTDTSILTAIGNDYGFEKIFSRQVEAIGVMGDMFIGISTSGNSKNVIEALKTCKDKGIVTVGLTGKSGGAMATICEYCIKVPTDKTPRVQETHILIGHIICSIVEEGLFGKGF